MKDLVDKFITQSEKEKIIEAVKNAESRTSGEIVPLIIDRSDNYDGYIKAGVVCISVFLSALFHYLVGFFSFEFIDSTLLFLLFYFLFNLVFLIVVRIFPEVGRIFVPEKELSERVAEKAFYEFYNQGLFKTRDKTGILLFISIFEKRVWIIADSGINSKIEEGTWDSIVSEVIRKIKNKENCKAIVGGIEKIGAILSENFPIKKDDTNELSDIIIRER